MRNSRLATSTPGSQSFEGVVRAASGRSDVRQVPLYGGVHLRSGLSMVENVLEA